MEMSLPSLISANVFAAFMIFMAARHHHMARLIWGLFFMLAAFFNYFTSVSNAEFYISVFGETAMLPFYKEFIYGFFTYYTKASLYMIATGQMIAGFLLLNKGVWFRIGAIGAIIFLLAITPLGSGAAFPAPLLMVVSIFILVYHGSTFTVLETQNLRQHNKNT